MAVTSILGVVGSSVLAKGVLVLEICRPLSLLRNDPLCVAGRCRINDCSIKIKGTSRSGFKVGRKNSFGISWPLLPASKTVKK